MVSEENLPQNHKHEHHMQDTTWHTFSWLMRQWWRCRQLHEHHAPDLTASDPFLSTYLVVKRLCPIVMLSKNILPACCTPDWRSLCQHKRFLLHCLWQVTSVGSVSRKGAVFFRSSVNPCYKLLWKAGKLITRPGIYICTSSDLQREMPWDNKNAGAE